MLSARPTPDLETLVGLFYTSAGELGNFEELSAEDMPPGERRLLAHHNHMTVTVEEFHNSPVDVRVLEKRRTDRHYARKILLTRQSDGRVVQFGIMRVNLDYLSDQVRREIEGESTPLGRILIRHNVLREVHLSQLWKITPGENLRKLFGLGKNVATYGRTAVIHCNGEAAAVELLEIITPCAGE